MREYRDRHVTAAAWEIHRRYGARFTRKLCECLDRLAFIETGEAAPERKGLELSAADGFDLGVPVRSKKNPDYWYDSETGHRVRDPNKADDSVNKVGLVQGEQLRVDDPATGKAKLAVERPYKVNIKDRTNRLLDEYARVFDEGDYTAAEEPRIVSELGRALDESFYRRGIAYMRAVVDEFGDEAKVMPEFIEFRNSMYEALKDTRRVAELHASEDTRGEAAKLNMRHVMTFATSMVRLSDALHTREAVGKDWTTPPSESGAFAPDHEPRDRQKFFEGYDPDALPAEMRGIEGKFEGDKYVYVFGGRPLKKTEQRAVEHYTGKGYREINNFLRLDDEGKAEELEERSLFTAKHERTLKALRGMFEELRPAEKPVTLYRGLRLSNQDTLAMMETIRSAYDSGQAIAMAGFSSCTADPGIATSYADVGGGKMNKAERTHTRGGAGNDIVFEISARKALRIGSLNADDYTGEYSEDEFLLDHDTEFDVAAVRDVLFIDGDGKRSFRTVVQLIQRV